TKICIVLVALLGVCVSVVVPRSVVTTENYHQLYLEENTQRALAETAAEHADLAQAARDNQINSLATELSGVRSDLAIERQAHTDDNHRNRTELAKRDETVKTLTAKVGNLAAGLEQVEQGRAIVTEQLNMALELINRLQGELTGTGNDLAAAEAEIDRLNATVKLLKEQLTQLQEAYDILAAKVPAEEQQDQPTTAVSQISGTVTAVRNDMASVNIGSVKGIKKGMTLYIYRGEHFIAHLRIIDVDDAESTGQIFDPREGASPQAGDKVATRLR
ncbi:MAG: hypothetical protein KAX80_13950, partial [Planctomycetes bacterium]|nr:hypothetical protein [Planctomycetota bacterium]